MKKIFYTTQEVKTPQDDVRARQLNDLEKEIQETNFIYDLFSSTLRWTKWMKDKVKKEKETL